MNLISVSVLFFQVALLLAQSSNRDTLKFSHVIFRHGDRNPRHVYGKYINNTDVFPEGLEQLTDLGKKHAFELGQFLRTRVTPVEYDNYFSLDAYCPIRKFLTRVPWRTFYVKRHFQDEPEILEYIFRQSGETALFDDPPNSTRLYEVFDEIQEVIHCLKFAVVNVMNAFDILPILHNRIPPFASAILVELHELPEYDEPVIEFCIQSHRVSHCEEVHFTAKYKWVKTMDS
ncbi:unnamed protein product [Allacma fusca]|uniref:acid phosphatase n=1 Tax=Allacma fusca TaxID=39272 RepID=A0A8J2NZC1_9HEXA|nr:unnamed protein product [Allacma fusca]